MGSMVKSIFDFSTPAKRFRFVAILEAITWLALIIAMIVKRVADNDGAVAVPGMVHGIVFVAFVVVAIIPAVALKWSPGVTALALVSSIPPFGTLVFEWWAARKGHLAELSTGPVEAAAAAA